MRELEERRFQKIYENIATGIALTVLDGFFEECNAAYSAQGLSLCVRHYKML